MADIAETRHNLPHGIGLNCRHSGQPGRPVLLFLHGFPEGAFAWDGLLAHFSQPENGGYFCVAPYLRGFETSSAPSDPAAYRAKFLVQDILALIDIVSPDHALAALVAHDWGGAVAWNLANQHPARLGRLVIINSPHPFITHPICHLMIMVLPFSTCIKPFPLNTFYVQHLKKIRID
jgi:pimeloyl-ACP methyl ester carboxylesterase